MIALPDFNAGAMENWGLITYRESAMLYNSNKAWIKNKLRVATVVAHELAHQWFGNLVTPKWWDDLWLNEGFASYVEYLGVDHVEPNWRVMDMHVIDDLHSVLAIDGLSTSHQISIPVSNPDEINEIFDQISYSKGASIIRMMSAFLTEPVFKDGLRKYLAALQYSNAEQADLWRYLTQAQLAANELNSVDVGRVMNTWTLQVGFPVVTLTRKYLDTDKEQAAQLEQNRFGSFSNSSSKQSTKSNNSPATKWDIPITYTWKSDSEANKIHNGTLIQTCVWLHQNDTQPTQLSSSQIPKSDNEWMLVNVQQVGYYRVNYDLRNWQLIVDQLFEDHKKFSVINRAQIFDDMFRFARVSMLDYKIVLTATKYLKNETEYLPWVSVLRSLSFIDDMLARSSIFGAWRDYVADIVAPHEARYRHVNWTLDEESNRQTIKDNDLLDEQNQVLFGSWASRIYKIYKEKARLAFENWKTSGKNRIDPKMRYPVYCTAIEYGEVSDWDFLWNQSEIEENPHEKQVLYRALTCTREAWIINRYLEWIFDKTKPIRRQDGSTIFVTIADNDYGRDVAFRFLREKWSLIKESYGKHSFAFSNLISSVSRAMNTRAELHEFIRFYESVKEDVGSGRRAFVQSIEAVETNIAWMDQNYRVLENWLIEYKLKVASNNKTTGS